MPASGASMPNVYTDINDFMPYARSMAKRIIREGKHDGVQQFTNDLVALSNDIYNLAQEMPGAWEQYRKITSERERQSREIAERQRYIEELNQHLAEQFGAPDVGSGDSDADILSMLSDDDAFDFGDSDDGKTLHNGTADNAMPATQPQQASPAAYTPDAGTDATQDDDDGLFAVFGGDYGDDGSGRDTAESDSWGNADERASLVGDDDDSFADAYSDAGNSDVPERNDDNDDSEQPDIDWSAAGYDDDQQGQPVMQSPLPQQRQQAVPAQPPQQKSTASDDPFDDDDIDVLLDDDALLNL